MKPDDKDAAEALRVAIAEIKKLGKTDPKAADAAFQCIVRAREAREAAAFSEFLIVEELPGDLEIGAVEATKEVIEPSVAAEDTPIIAVSGKLIKPEIAVRDTIVHDFELPDSPEVADETTKPKGLREEMRAAALRLSGGISEDDPLATDKRKVANKLKKLGRTTADLPYDFWKLPIIARSPGERSRTNELYKISAEVETQQIEAKRLAELAKRCRPANYDRLSRDERKKVDGKIRQQKHRDKKPKSASKPSAAPLPVAQFAGGDLRSTLAAMQKSLEKWVINCSTPLSRQLPERKQQLAIIKTAAAYSRFYQQCGKIPSQSKLGKWLRCSRHQARRRLEILTSLYKPGGPWTRA